LNGIRVVLTTTPANPELFADLSEVPARLRAERVRTLATLGLVALSGGIALTRPTALASTETEERGKRELTQGEPPRRALNFAKSLGDGM
jgi:hypothetical protein